MRSLETVRAAFSVSIASRSWPLVAEDGSTGVPDIPELVDGLCTVREGDNQLETDDIDG